MSFKVHTVESAPEGLKAQLEQSQKAFQFIPNLHAIFAESPQVLEAYKTITGLFVKSSLDTVERHVVWLAINVENECHYCIPAHSMLATMDGVSKETISALRNKTPIGNEKLDGLREMTLSILRNKGQVPQEEVAAFRALGYTNQNILDIILGIAHKTLSNYTNHFAQTPVDDAFASFV